MLLTISTTHPAAGDLSFLLHKHPGRLQSFDLSFGKAHVFYPELSGDRCTCCLLLDVDPVGIVRRKGKFQHDQWGQYVNDRAYVASSFMSVAISQVFRTALGGRCEEKPELVTAPLPFEVRLEVLPVRGGEEFLQQMFQPLGYEVTATRHPLDERFAEWGDSPYFSVELKGEKTLSELLTHLYVLIPVFDNQKHYYVGDDELEKLLSKGTGWLAEHPGKELISRRYLNYRPSLYRQALARLLEEVPGADDDPEPTTDLQEEVLEQPLSLNEQRYGSVLAALRGSGARSVLDLGCGEGRLLNELLKDKQFQRIAGLDVSIRALEVANRRLKLERLPARDAERIKLLHGSLMYRDQRLEGFDAAAVVEVIEHLDPPRLAALERVVFEFAKPKTVVVTTPNREYNALWESLPAGRFRHSGHRFEWMREEFQDWAERVADRHNYTVRYLPVGPQDDRLGAPTQMGLFERAIQQEQKA